MGYLYILGAAACWALIGPFSRYAFAAGVAPLEVAFWRAVIGGVLFALHARVGRAKPVVRGDLPAVGVFGLLGVSVFYGAYVLAVDAGGAALAAVLLYTAPAWVALMSAVWLHEPMTRRKLGAVALTIVGVAAIAMGGGGVRVTAAAVLWGLVSGFCYALYYPFGKRFFTRYQPVAVYAWALPIGALALLPFVPFSASGMQAWLAIAFLGLVTTYLAYLLYGFGLQRLEATRASIVATVEPVIAGAVAYAWWGERFGPWAFVGAVLVLVGVVLATLRSKEVGNRSKSDR